MASTEIFTSIVLQTSPTSPPTSSSMSSLNATPVAEVAAPTIDLSVAWLIIVGSIYGLIILLTLVGNAFVMAAYAVDEKIRSRPANLLILNLSVSDFCVGITLIFNFIFLLYDQWTFGEIPCRFWVLLDYTSSVMSVTNITLISLDRYWMVKKKLGYRKFQTHRRISITIGVCWGVLLTYYSITAFGYGAFTNTHHVDYSEACEMEYLYNIPFSVAMIFVEFVIPLVIITYLNIVVYQNVKLRTGTKLVRSKPDPELPTPSKSSYDLDKSYGNDTVNAASGLDDAARSENTKSPATATVSFTVSQDNTYSQNDGAVDEEAPDDDNESLESDVENTAISSQQDATGIANHNKTDGNDIVTKDKEIANQHSLSESKMVANTDILSQQDPEHDNRPAQARGTTERIEGTVPLADSCLPCDDEQTIMNSPNRLDAEDLARSDRDMQNIENIEESTANAAIRSVEQIVVQQKEECDVQTDTCADPPTNNNTIINANDVIIIDETHLIEQRDNEKNHDMTSEATETSEITNISAENTLSTTNGTGAHANHDATTNMTNTVGDKGTSNAIYMNLSGNAQSAQSGGPGESVDMTAQNGSGKQISNSKQYLSVSNLTLDSISVSRASTDDLSDNQPRRAAAVEMKKRKNKKAREERKKKSREEHRQRRAAIVLFVLVVAFGFCWLPYQITTIISTVAGDDVVPELIAEIVTNLLWCNSLINPFLYALVTVQFRRNFLRFLGLQNVVCCCKKKSSQAALTTQGKSAPEGASSDTP